MPSARPADYTLAPSIATQFVLLAQQYLERHSMEPNFEVIFNHRLLDIMDRVMEEVDGLYSQLWLSHHEQASLRAQLQELEALLEESNREVDGAAAKMREHMELLSIAAVKEDKAELARKRDAMATRMLQAEVQYWKNKTALKDDLPDTKASSSSDESLVKRQRSSSV